QLGKSATVVTFEHQFFVLSVAIAGQVTGDGVAGKVSFDLAIEALQLEMFDWAAAPTQFEKIAGAVGARINVLDESQKGEPCRHTIQFDSRRAVLPNTVNSAHVSR